MSVRRFYELTLGALDELGITVRMLKRPVEVVEAIPFDVLFGPAYKGIPLVATSAVALADHIAVVLLGVALGILAHEPGGTHLHQPGQVGPRGRDWPQAMGDPC